MGWAEKGRGQPVLQHGPAAFPLISHWDALEFHLKALDPSPGEWGRLIFCSLHDF